MQDRKEQDDKKEERKLIKEKAVFRRLGQLKNNRKNKRNYATQTNAKYKQ